MLPLTISPQIHVINSLMEQHRAETDLITKQMTSVEKIEMNKCDIESFNNLKIELGALVVAAEQAAAERDAIRSRLEEKIEESEKQHLKLDRDAIQYKRDIEKYTKIKEQMEKQVEKLSKFESFLNSVVDTSDTFNSVGDVLNRYETLEMMERNIAARLKTEQEAPTLLR